MRTTTARIAACLAWIVALSCGAKSPLDAPLETGASVTDAAVEVAASPPAEGGRDAAAPLKCVPNGTGYGVTYNVPSCQVSINEACGDYAVQRTVTCTCPDATCECATTAENGVVSSFTVPFGGCPDVCPAGYQQVYTSPPFNVPFGVCGFPEPGP
jgi:hypothetical protein